MGHGQSRAWRLERVDRHSGRRVELPLLDSPDDDWRGERLERRHAAVCRSVLLTGRTEYAGSKGYGGRGGSEGSVQEVRGFEGSTVRTSGPTFESLNPSS